MVSSLLLTLLVCSYGSIALVLAAGHQRHNKFTVVPTASFHSSEASCSTTRGIQWIKYCTMPCFLNLNRTPSSLHSWTDPHSNRVSVPLAHRNGPCAPVQTTKHELSLAEMLRRDRERTEHVTRRVSKSKRRLQSDDDAVVSVPAQLGSSYNSQMYVVTVGLGTPAVPQTLILDTGSDLTWVQCKPCNSTDCYRQRLPLFDPSTSSSYSPVPCDSPECRALAAGIDGDGCTDNWDCAYKISYGSGAVPTGTYSRDALTLAPGAVVDSFLFGCGHHQDPKFDMADGILGLGRLPQSLAWQASARHTGGVFSLCLPPTGSSTGFLALGAPNDTSGFVFTPLLTMDEQPWFYQLMPTGISVAGEPLDIPPAVFREGVITDSGMVTSVLQATAYATLRDAFRRAMAEYPLAPPVGHLDTCYNFTGYDNVTVPTVSLTFRGGATVDLDAESGVLLDGCLAFWGQQGDEYTGIIGSVNQRTIEVLYDMPRGKVGFRTGAC